MTKAGRHLSSRLSNSVVRLPDELGTAVGSNTSGWIAFGRLKERYTARLPSFYAAHCRSPIALGGRYLDLPVMREPSITAGRSLTRVRGNELLESPPGADTVPEPDRRRALRY